MTEEPKSYTFRARFFIQAKCVLAGKNYFKD